MRGGGQRSDRAHVGWVVSGSVRALREAVPHRYRMDRARQEQGQGGDRPAVPADLRRRPASRADGATGPGPQRTRGPCAGTVVHPGSSFAPRAPPTPTRVPASTACARRLPNRCAHLRPAPVAPARPPRAEARSRSRSSDRQPSRRVVLSEAGTEGGGRARAAPCALAVGRRRDLRAGRNRPRHRARCDPWLRGRAPRRSPEPQAGAAHDHGPPVQLRLGRNAARAGARRPREAAGRPGRVPPGVPRRDDRQHVRLLLRPRHRASRTRSASTTRPG